MYWMKNVYLYIKNIVFKNVNLENLKLIIKERLIIWEYINLWRDVKWWDIICIVFFFC